MKKLLLLLLFITSCASDDFDNDIKKLDFFLCIGQSNMAGRADFNQTDSIPDENIYIFNNINDWEIAKYPLNKYSNIRKHISYQKLGPSWAFGKELLNFFPKIGLVINARGGTSIDQWQKDSLYFNKTIERMVEASKIGNLRGIIWHQGENDLANHINYSERLKSLVIDIRYKLNKPNLPFISGEIGNWQNSKRDSINTLNLIIKNIDLNNYDFIITSDLSHVGDSIHFDKESQIEIGKRFALKYLENN